MSKPLDLIEVMARAIREETLRQYRDDDRGKLGNGVTYYEEEIAPGLCAAAALAALEKEKYVVLHRDSFVSLAADAVSKMHGVDHPQAVYTPKPPKEES